MHLAVLLLTLCVQHETSPEQRRETYAVIRATCTLAGGTYHVCEAAVAMAWRESRGVYWRDHTRGKNERGVGLFAHSPKYWRWLVGGNDAAFCSPILAALALLREFEFAIEGGAVSLRDLQRVHAGRPATVGSVVGDARWCYLLEHGPRDDRHVVTWGVSCHEPVWCIGECDSGR